ncbi:hypothetical protein CTA1_9265, partial [Colletotrichum tanaceti]
MVQGGNRRQSSDVTNPKFETATHRLRLGTHAADGLVLFGPRTYRPRAIWI